MGIEGERKANSEIKILIADDSSTFRKIIRDILEKEDYYTFEATNGQEALDLAVFENPDCVLLDVEMPLINGIEVCKRLRRHPATSLIPIIFISHRYTVQEITEGLRAGADDYVIKPFSEVELLARVQVVIDRLLIRLHRSPMTGLPDEVSAERDIAVRKGPFALSFIDLVDFLAYNERYGFESGDRLLKQLARIANSTMQFLGEEGDHLYHCGQDDFIILTSQEVAERICSHLIERFDQHIAGSLGSVEEGGKVKAPINMNACILNVGDDRPHFKVLRNRGWELMRRAQAEEPGTVSVFEAPAGKEENG